MEIGMTLNIKVEEKPHVYRSKIIDKDHKYLYIDYPIDMKTNKSVFIPIKQQMNVTFIKDGVPYQFSSQLISTVQLAVPALLIAAPELEDLKRVQRREFVRIEAMVDAAVHCPKGSFSPFTTVTQNISGGGAAIITPPIIDFHHEQMVRLYLVLKSKTSDFTYIKTMAKIVRVYLRGNKNVISVKFHFEHKNNQEKIINFCFTTQREQRKQKMEQQL
ncbi:MAG TPA: flagellar brake domain-containing protein [Pseudogracilibacillus sp.]|nr:flagellar brake domain-containing protein [Pseudogracilibacillus sp.]